MSLEAGDIDFACDLFSEMPHLTTSRMFGGLALYSDGVIFALMRSDATLLLKAPKGPFADSLAASGSEQWTYQRKNGAASSMPYWSLPEAALDDPAFACALAREALSAQG
ncbi:MAG: TfoX/Sxy family protein [Sulfitobacter sp.]|nr:TfoX/Sxy family protein [Sulfitobacter sp.]